MNDNNIFETVDLSRTNTYKDDNPNFNIIINDYSNDYIESLKENYEADEILFDALNDLMNEGKEKDKLIKVLDSL